MKITILQIQQLAADFVLRISRLRAVIDVEGSGNGFDPKTQKILIQFEPHHFRKYDVAGYKKYLLIKGKIENKQPITILEKGFFLDYSFVLSNKVEGQAAEWKTFNTAFKINKTAAMLSTSIGMMQVMGFNHLACGFSTVDEMWNFAKVSEKNQVILGLRFIKQNRKMFKALQDGDFDTFAFYYNGKEYKKFNYHERLRAAEKKYLS